METPIKLLLEQGPMLKTLGRIAVKTALPSKDKKAKNPESFPVVSEIIPSPSPELIRNYVRWAGVTDNRYSTTLPPHMFTQFALPICTQQIEMTRYNLGGIINQGCGITIYDAIPMGSDLKIDCEVVSINEENGRARIHQRLAIGPASGKKSLDVDFYTAFIIGKSEKKTKKTEEKPEFVALGAWDAKSNDGFEFGVLTGDLNPIHWISPIAKMSPFKGKVLHGFGMFVRTFELIQRERKSDIQSMDIRFISPVKLPSKGNEVWVSTTTQEDETYRLEQRNSTGKVQIIGHFQ